MHTQSKVGCWWPRAACYPFSKIALTLTSPGRHVAVGDDAHEIRAGLPQPLERPLLEGVIEVSEDPAQVSVRCGNRTYSARLPVRKEPGGMQSESTLPRGVPRVYPPPERNTGPRGWPMVMRSAVSVLPWSDSVPSAMMKTPAFTDAALVDEPSVLR
jgi:hypothetical protein